MTRSTDITSYTEHRRKLREHFDQVKKTGRPLYVTTNGVTEAVVLSPLAFDQLMEKAEILDRLAAIDRGLEEVKAGRTQDLRDGILRIAEKHGLSLES